MERVQTLAGTVLDEVALTLDELAQACAVEPSWIAERVDAELLGCVGGRTAELRFASAELVRTRRLVSLERDFDANPELAALVVDLIEELEQLRRQLPSAGRRPMR